MKVCYVTYPSEKPWGSDFAALNLKKHSRFTVEPVNLSDADRCEDAVVHIHNVQNAAKLNISALKRRNRAVVAGVRGRNGLGCNLESFDAVAVNADPRLSAEVKTRHPNVHILPAGVDTEVFKPSDAKPQRFTVGWVGSDNKDFKNSALLDRFMQPVRAATYRRYIPHGEMPGFYHSVSAVAILSEHEGFCLPLVEAAACGLPVVSHDVGVSRAVLGAEWIVEESPKRDFAGYKERMDALSVDPELCQRVGEDNRRRSLAFGWEKVAELYDAFWGTL